MKKGKKILRFPLVKIILGILIIAGIPLVINRFLLKQIFTVIGVEETVNRSIRMILTILILMPFLYRILYSKLESRKITELSKRGLAKDMFTGLFLSTGMISLVLFALALLGHFFIESFNPQLSLFPLIIPLISMVFVEELLFRGIIYRIVEESLGTNLSLLISGLLFGAFHITNESMNIMSFIAIVIGGMMVSIMFTHTKKIWLPVFFHFGWNFTQILYGVTLSGEEEYKVSALFKSHITGPEILTGGSFGPENSIFTLALTLFVFILIYWLCSKKGKIFKLRSRKCI